MNVHRQQMRRLIFAAPVSMAARGIIAWAINSTVREVTASRNRVRGGCSIAGLAVALVAFTLGLASSAYATSGSDWLPLTGSDIKVGCTWNNGCDGAYHGAGAKAIDFIVPAGRPVYASGAGTITQAQGGCGPNSNGCNGSRGNFITINHGSHSSRYLHLSSHVVTSGSVAAGQLIAYTGSSGQNAVPHLHYDELTDPVGGSGKLDPGTLYSCHGSTKVAYPGVGGWPGIPNWQTNLRNDGYSCTAPDTPPVPGATSNHYTYSRGGDGAVHIMYWNGSSWSDQALGGSMAAGSSPSAYMASNGNHYAYFRGSDGAVHIMYWNGSSWSDQRLGGNMADGASPSAYTAANGNHYVYFRGTDGAVNVMFWNGSSWQVQRLGGSMAAGSSPSAYTASNGNHYVYFRGGDGAVHIMYWNGSSWSDQALGGSMAAGSSPSAY